MRFTQQCVLLLPLVYPQQEPQALESTLQDSMLG